MKDLFKFCGDISRKKQTLCGIVGAVVLILLWYGISKSGMMSEKILPNPVDVVCSIPSLYSDYHLVGNMVYSVGLNLSGYVYALIFALPLGFIISLYPAPRAMFQKPIEAIRFIPLPAATGIFIAAFGIDWTMKSIFMGVSIFIYILPAVVQRMSDLQNPVNVKDNVYLQTAKTIGMTNWQTFRYVMWPYTMSKIYPEIRSICAISYTYVTICESLNKTGGLGAMISTFTRQSHIEYVYALLFIIVLIGILQDYIFKVMEPVLFKYKKA